VFAVILNSRNGISFLPCLGCLFLASCSKIFIYFARNNKQIISKTGGKTINLNINLYLEGLQSNIVFTADILSYDVAYDALELIKRKISKICNPILQKLIYKFGLNAPLENYFTDAKISLVLEE
jgi:hypothetical protein